MVVHHLGMHLARTLAKAGAGAVLGGALSRLFKGKPTLPENVEAGPDGGLRPLPGFRWANDRPGEFSVVWVAGAEITDRHIIAGQAPGQWYPMPGYEWVNPGQQDSVAVRWVPGSAHGEAPHVIAAQAEGKWRAAIGYRWVSGELGDLRVEPVGAGGGAENESPSGARIQQIKDLAMLGLDEDAAMNQVEEAFRRLAKLHHPDRFVRSGAQAIAEATRAFGLLRKAYERVKSARPCSQ